MRWCRTKKAAEIPESQRIRGKEAGASEKGNLVLVPASAWFDLQGSTVATSLGATRSGDHQIALSEELTHASIIGRSRHEFGPRDV